MDRETFRSLIVPLTPYEESLRDAQPVCHPLTESIEHTLIPDADGYYFFSNQHMRTTRHAANRLHDPIIPEGYEDQLRLLVHSRFSKIPFHYDEFISVNYVYSGRMKLHFPNQDFVIRQGQLFFMSANVVHSFEIEGESDIVIGFQIEKEFLNTRFLYGLRGDSPVVDFLMKTINGQESRFSYIIADYQQDDRMKNLFEDLFCEILEPSLCSQALVECYIRNFLILLLRGSGGRAPMRADEGIMDIVNHIDAHCSTCTLADLAQRFGFSQKYLSNLIKKKTGRSFTALLAEARMRRITYYLANSDLPVREIAESCGYSNLNHFYQKFQEAYQMTPGEYRAARQNLKA